MTSVLKSAAIKANDPALIAGMAQIVGATPDLPGDRAWRRQRHQVAAQLGIELRYVDGLRVTDAVIKQRWRWRWRAGEYLAGGSADQSGSAGAGLQRVIAGCCVARSPQHPGADLERVGEVAQ
ncbi:MAG: hypothetical protein U0528_09220 [Anaerolineae bacterium]